MPDVLSIFLLVLVGLIIIGPRRLPESLEALWLALTDYSRTQRGLPPLGSLHNARIFWASEKNNVFAFIQLLYRVTEHLEELRRRLLLSLLVVSAAFALAFFFAQPLLGLIIRPISLSPLKAVPDAPVNNYVVAADTQFTGQVETSAGVISGTITVPAGTTLPLALPSPRPVFMHPTELFTTYIKLSLVAAVGASLPVLVWQLLMFLRGPVYPAARMKRAEWETFRAGLQPAELAAAERERAAVYQGLTASEMRPLYLLVPLAGILFAAGVLFTYFFLLPSAVDFLYGLGGNLVQPLPALDDYIGFALSLLFWVGISFQTPLVMFFLARFHLISARQFQRFWQYAVVIILIIAAVITPTTDPFNMMLLAIPMLLLYVIGLALARLA